MAKKKSATIDVAVSDVHPSHLVHDLGVHAHHYADAAMDWTAPRVAAAIDWASPRAQRAYERAMRAAAPKVRRAAERLEPMVDTAHDKIVDDILPGIVETVTAAAAGASIAAEEATRRTKDAARVIKGEAVAVPKKKSKLGKIALWVGIGTVVAAAGYVAWQRLRPLDDPWAEDEWDEEVVVVEPTVAASLKEAANAAKDAATSAAHKAEDAAKSAAEAAKAAAKKTTSAVKKAADDATS